MIQEILAVVGMRLLGQGDLRSLDICLTNVHLISLHLSCLVRSWRRELCTAAWTAASTVTKANTWCCPADRL